MFWAIKMVLLPSVLQVSYNADTILSAQLPQSWLPMGDDVALLETSMRLRGYDVQIISLRSTPSFFGAQFIYPNLPPPNTTAFKLDLNVRCSRLITPKPCQ